MPWAGMLPPGGGRRAGWAPEPLPGRHSPPVVALVLSAAGFCRAGRCQAESGLPDGRAPAATRSCRCSWPKAICPSRAPAAASGLNGLSTASASPPPSASPDAPGSLAEWAPARSSLAYSLGVGDEMRP
jgi:hypothetical protein